MDTATIRSLSPALRPPIPSEHRGTSVAKVFGALAFLTLLTGRAFSAIETVHVDGTANILGAGHSTSPNPGGAGAGTLPVLVDLLPGSVEFSFSYVAGTVGFGPNAATEQGIGAEGLYRPAGDAASTLSYDGISGIINQHRFFFLSGVFLGDSEPVDPAPARLDFTNNDSFDSLSPEIGQTFFIGDGLTGDGSGATQRYFVPAGATRLFLGFHDRGPGAGLPGYYGDNSGTLVVDVSQLQVPEPASLVVWSFLGVVGAGVAWRRSRRASRLCSKTRAVRVG